MRVWLSCALALTASIAVPAFAQNSAGNCPKPGCAPSGGPVAVPVPEPGAMLIFAAGAGWLMRRQTGKRAPK